MRYICLILMNKHKISRLFFSRSFEKMGLIPRSILRTFNRFYQQLVSNTKNSVLYEFRISRYQTIAAVKCFINFIFIPYIFHSCVQDRILYPLLDSVIKRNTWPLTSKWISINPIQDEKFYTKFKNFDDQFFFDALIHYKLQVHSVQTVRTEQTDARFSNPPAYDPVSSDSKRIIEQSSHDTIQNVISYQFAVMSIAEQRYTQLIHLLASVLSDCLTLVLVWNLLLVSTPQLIIFKSFLIESIYNMSDTTKSFLIILTTDLLVGFHSSKGWELCLENVLFHFGFSAHKDFIFLVVSTFPVILDTIFKYWIFRYLNKISPSTVATYQNMIE